ncbi:phosphoenolpyruvate carboxykinase [GTP], mitochondrial-like isoform X2 [Dicentrarchus labrax]|uniref:phosphoenolpyruvate carboxykinase [GTP], mitochondrial-like isoform X1 n=1 Tax=Dicentrarchus labrax TaxID=13489 RepID=UPI0021F5CA09|nr:phosphoenolpyruvate carboxykinase [GTP], mitochondrial-like isoform X1 [Dicentrarchus labrax]XP_051267490.1 phosphoenolpyruvate carboxykinase [GTP], mitochondrial-like isoform X2 [Dicentrarchus labrax]
MLDASWLGIRGAQKILSPLSSSLLSSGPALLCGGEMEDNVAKKSIIGWLPEDGAINTKGLSSKVDMGALFHVPTSFWQKETKELRAYFTQQVEADLPAQVEAELKALEDRVHN